MHKTLEVKPDVYYTPIGDIAKMREAVRNGQSLVMDQKVIAIHSTGGDTPNFAVVPYPAIEVVPLVVVMFVALCCMYQPDFTVKQQNIEIWDEIIKGQKNNGADSVGGPKGTHAS